MPTALVAGAAGLAAAWLGWRAFRWSPLCHERERTVCPHGDAVFADDGRTVVLAVCARSYRRPTERCRFPTGGVPIAVRTTVAFYEIDRATGAARRLELFLLGRSRATIRAVRFRGQSGAVLYAEAGEGPRSVWFEVDRDAGAVRVLPGRPAIGEGEQRAGRPRRHPPVGDPRDPSGVRRLHVSPRPSGSVDEARLVVRLMDVRPSSEGAPVDVAEVADWEAHRR